MAVKVCEFCNGSRYVCERHRDKQWGKCCGSGGQICVCHPMHPDHKQPKIEFCKKCGDAI